MIRKGMNAEFEQANFQDGLKDKSNYAALN